MKLKILVLNLLIFVLFLSQSLAAQKTKNLENDFTKIKRILLIDKLTVENVQEGAGIEKRLKNELFTLEVLKKVYDFYKNVFGSGYDNIFSNKRKKFNIRFTTQEDLKKIYRKDPMLLINDLGEDMQKSLKVGYERSYKKMMEENRRLVEKKEITQKELDLQVKNELADILWDGFLKDNLPGGWTSRSSNTIFIFELPSKIFETIKTDNDLINTYAFMIAHEMGHLFGHLKHPEPNEYGERNLMDLTSLGLDDIKYMNVQLSLEQVKQFYQR